ncbi:putative transposase, partial [Neisseria meningitidis NM3222]
MSTFFQQTAQAMIAKHIDRFPLLKLDQVIDWQPIEQYLNRQRTHLPETTAAVPPIRCYPCSKPSCSDNGTASPIPNSNTASSPASTQPVLPFDELSIPDYST